METQGAPNASAKPRKRTRLEFVIKVFRSKSANAQQHDPIQTTQSLTKDQTTTVSSESAVHVVKEHAAQTFIQGFRAFEILGGCHLIPLMPIPPEHSSVWESSFKDRLEDELAQWLGASVWGHAEFLMVRDKDGKIDPYIVLLFWDDNSCNSERGREATRKSLQKKMQKQECMKNCPYPCKVIVDKTQLLSPATSPSPHAGSVITVVVPHDLVTYVGMAISRETLPEQTCTLGGLIWVEQTPYALTVAHPFQQWPLLDAESAASNHSLVNESEFDTGTESDVHLFADRDSTNIPEKIEQKHLATIQSEKAPSLSTRDHDIDQNMERMALDLNPRKPGRMHSIKTNAKGMTDSANTSDWLLIELDKDLEPLANSYLDPKSSKKIELKDFARDDTRQGGKAWVLTAKRGAQVATIGQTNLKMRLMGTSVKATQLVMEAPLIQNETVLGYIFAGQQWLPLAYMISISTIVDELVSTFQIESISILPTGTFKEREAEGHSIEHTEANFLTDGFFQISGNQVLEQDERPEVSEEAKYSLSDSNHAVTMTQLVEMQTGIVLHEDDISTATSLPNTGRLPTGRYHIDNHPEAEPIGPASGLMTLATFAFQSCSTLYNTIRGFRFHPKRVHDLIEELEALSGVLGLLTETIGDATDVALSALDLPLLRCGTACKEFEQEIIKCASRSGGGRTSFRDWAKLRYMSDDIDGFRGLLTSYKLTIRIALADANLRKSSITAEVLESYNDLIKSTTADLEAHLKNIDQKLKVIFEQTATESDSDAAEQQILKKDQLSTQRYFRMCALLSEYIGQIQLMPNGAKTSTGIADLDTFPERVTKKGLQQCKNSLIQTAAELERHLHELMDQMVTRSKTALTSKEAVTDLIRLRDEWETTRQCMDICSRADHHLIENISTIDGYATGDSAQFMVSTNGDMIFGKNQGFGWRTRQLIGHLDDASVQQLSRDITSIQHTRNEASDAQADMSSLADAAVGSRTISQFQERYGHGFKLTSKLS